MRIAIVVAASWNYLPYVNALLNSIEFRGIASDPGTTVYLVHDEFRGRYLEDAVRLLRFRLVPIELPRAEFPAGTSRNRLNKLARYRILRRVAADADVACLLDADMMIVSAEFRNLFDLVSGTQLLIGCNEQFKWTVCAPGANSLRYFLDGRPLFDAPRTLWKFHCSVPVVFRPQEWLEVLDLYDRLAWQGYELKEGRSEPIGDIFAWNLAVEALDRSSRVVLLPMEALCQVHQTNARRWTRIVGDRGPWRTAAGDPVLSLHGRVCEDAWQQQHRRALEESGSSAELRWKDVDRTLSAIRGEWVRLNNSGTLRLGDYVPIDSVMRSCGRWSD